MTPEKDDPQYQLANGKKATTMNAKANRGRNYLKGIVTQPKDWGYMHGDDTPFDPSPLLRFKKAIIWGAIHFANKLPNSTSWLIWDKRDGVPSDDNADCECAWTNIGGPTRLHRQLWKGICRTGGENISIQGSKYHPFQKPLALMLWCLSLCLDAETIIDPFIGSGTTAIACEKLNRRWIGIEISEEYCAIAKRRIIKETKQLKIPGF